MEQTVESTAPSNGAAEAATQAPDPRDYLARAASDPEFAVEQIKKHQSDAAKARNELKALAPLKDVVAQVGGAQRLLQIAYEQAAIEQHPTAKEILNHYRTFGTLPTTPAPSRDESSDVYVDPMDQLRTEMKEMRDMFMADRSRAQRDRALITHTATQSYLQKTADKYSDIWDIISDSVTARAEQFEATPQGREMLAGSTQDTWENFAKLAIGDNLDAVMARRAEKRVQAQEGLGTEPRSRTVTTGREDPIRQEEPWKPGKARALMADIWRREGRSV